MKYGGRLIAKIGIGIIVILLLGLCGVGKTLPKGVIPAPLTGSVVVGITTDRGTYAPGDTIKIAITVDKSCYLYLYDIDPAETVTLLFPNRFQSDPHVPAGKLVLPGKGYRLVIASPEGEETLVALASVAPIPLLVPDKKVPFRAFKLTPLEFAKKLTAVLPHGGYSTAWTQIHVYQPKGTVLISSAPEGARIYVNGDYVGTTPKALVLPAGENTVTLQKDGFRPYTQTIALADRTAAEISARLEQAPLPPPSVQTGAPLSGFLALDFGKDSLGGEFGIGQVLGVSIAARFLDDPRIDGPELVLGIRLHVPAQGTLRGILGLGIGLQERYVVAPSEVLIPESIVPEPETETRLFPSLTIGLEIHYKYGYLFGGYDLRRGLIGGMGIAF